MHESAASKLLGQSRQELTSHVRPVLLRRQGGEMVLQVALPDVLAVGDRRGAQVLLGEWKVGLLPKVADTLLLRIDVGSVLGIERSMSSSRLSFSDFAFVE